ncbi:hypothetical protein SCAR479_00352 [Seiridium cardinale]|uniref:Uncharacterized protein n=1 Tax=Seiridium cardinale TaxID=138064 RepID=A0ABR2Y999_9PEZI
MAYAHENIQSDLVRWLDFFEGSRAYLQEKDFSGRACHLLREYHSMATIMAATCLAPEDQSAFDSYTDQFLLITQQSLEMWKILRSMPGLKVLPKHRVHLSESMVDFGWIPPLYYTALKCRVHRIRIQAIRLIEASSHREAIWYSNIVAILARKVMELEEGIFYGDTSAADNFTLSRFPSRKDLSVQTLPDLNRIQVVEVTLVDDPVSSVLLCYKAQHANRKWVDVRIFVTGVW